VASARAALHDRIADVDNHVARPATLQALEQELSRLLTNPAAVDDYTGERWVDVLGEIEAAKTDDGEFIGDLELASTRLFENTQGQKVRAAENRLRIEAFLEQGSEPLSSQLQR